MAERFLPTEDPVMEAVLQWTVERDAKDVRRLLEWLPEARSSRERKALMERVRSLLEELEDAMNKLFLMPPVQPIKNICIVNKEDNKEKEEKETTILNANMEKFSEIVYTSMYEQFGQVLVCSPIQKKLLLLLLLLLLIIEELSQPQHRRRASGQEEGREWRGWHLASLPS